MENKMFSASPDIQGYEISFKDIKAGLSPTIAFPEKFSGSFLFNLEKTKKKRGTFSIDHYYYNKRHPLFPNITIHIGVYSNVMIGIKCDFGYEQYWGEIVDNILVFEADHKHCFIKILDEKNIQLNVYSLGQAMYSKDNKCEYEWDRSAYIYDLIDSSGTLK